MCVNVCSFRSISYYFLYVPCRIATLLFLFSIFFGGLPASVNIAGISHFNGYDPCVSKQLSFYKQTELIFLESLFYSIVSSVFCVCLFAPDTEKLFQYIFVQPNGSAHPPRLSTGLLHTYIHINLSKHLLFTFRAVEIIVRLPKLKWLHFSFFFPRKSSLFFLHHFSFILVLLFLATILYAPIKL